MNLHNHGGEFSKSISVTTNAKNNPHFRLSISGIFIPLLQFDPEGTLQLHAKRDTGDIVTIKTARRNLQITEVTFQEGGKQPDFKSFIPITYSLSPPDSVKGEKTPPAAVKGKEKGKTPSATNAGAAYVFTLRLKYVPFSIEDQFGDFVIKTNVPEKPEIKISGILEAKPK